jgi:hypothetical protein
MEHERSQGTRNVKIKKNSSPKKIKNKKDVVHAK